MMSHLAEILRPVLRWLLLAGLALAAGASAAEAQAWTAHRLGDVTFEVPSDWKVIRKARDRSVSFESADGDYQFEAFWWFPDEPLLGGDDIVSHKTITVAGKPATYIYSVFPSNQVLLVALNEARADKRQFLMRLESGRHDFRGGSPVMEEILAKVRFADKKAEQPIGTSPTVQSTPTKSAVTGAWTAYEDKEAGLALRYPEGWKKGITQRDGVSILTLAAPDKKGLALIAVFEPTAERAVPDAMKAFETLYYSDYVLPDSIEGNGDVQIGDLAGAYVEMIGTIYSIEGVSLPFTQGWSWLFQGTQGDKGYAVALVSDPAAPESVKTTLLKIAAGVRVGADAASRLAEMEGEAATTAGQGATAGQDAVVPAIAAQETGAASGALAAVGQHFGADCAPADPATLPSALRQVIAARPQGHLKWVLMCRGGVYRVLGMDFDFDPRGATADFFHPLYFELLQANGSFPYAIAMPADGIAVRVSSTGPDAMSIDLEDLPATAGDAPVTAPETPLEKGGSLPVTPPTQAARDPDALLGEGQTQRVDLFDGTLDAARWHKFERPGGSFEKVARLQGGALVIDVTAGKNPPYVGIYSEKPLVWLDRFGAGAETRVTFAFDPARTDNFNIALASHLGLNGNAPGGATAMVSWRTQAPGSAIATFSVNGKTVWQIKTKESVPATVSLVVTPSGVHVEAEGLPVDEDPWRPRSQGETLASAAAEGQGFRVYAYVMPSAKDPGARMALTKIALERAAGAPVPAPTPAEGVKPLPAQVLFDGTPGRTWELAGSHGADFKDFGAFTKGGMRVDIPEKKIQWPRAGLLSSVPVVVLDARVKAIPHDLILQIDPKGTTGLLVMFNSNKVADMWRQSMAGAVGLVRASEGDRKGDYILMLRTGNGPYGVWERPVPADFIEKAWDGRLVITFGQRWMAARLPGGPSVRGTGFVTGDGYELFATIYTNSDKPYGAARLTLKSVASQWETPDGMTQMDRWRFVNGDAFDPAGFIVDAAREIPDGKGGAQVPGGIVDDMIFVPTLTPGKLPQIAPEKQGALQRLRRLGALLNPITPAYAAKDCTAALDAHIDDMRRIEIALGDQPDVLKSFLSLGETILGSASLGSGNAEQIRAQLSNALSAMHDGIAIGEDWAAGNDTDTVIHVMQAALNVGLSSDALMDSRTFRQSVSKDVRATWAKAMKDLKPEQAQRLIMEAAAKFNPGAKIDPSGVYATILKEGQNFDFGTIFGTAAGGGSGDTRADISAAAWTLTNATLGTFSPHYKVAKAVADTMLETAKATKAFVVNDRVRAMYEVYKEQKLENDGLESQAFYDAYTSRGDRIPLNEMIAMMRTSPDQKIDERAAEARLFKLFDQWYAAEKEAGRKSDRLAGLRNRYQGLECHYALGRSIWPDGRKASSKAWEDLTAKGTYADRAVKTWNNFWNSCQPEIEELQKYSELEAKTRASLLEWLGKDNACAEKASLDHDVDRLICRLLDDGEDAYRALLKQRLADCGAIKEPDAATKKERADHVFERLVNLDHARQTQVLDALGITPPQGFYDCLCLKGAYGSPGTHQYYRPDFIPPYDKRYSCNVSSQSNPCIVSGYGCTRHPLPTDAKAWSFCMALHKFDMKTGADGKPDPKTGTRLDEKIEQALRNQRFNP